MLRSRLLVVPLVFAWSACGTSDADTGNQGPVLAEVCGNRVDDDADGLDDFADSDCLVGMELQQSLQDVADDSRGAVGALVVGVATADGKVALAASGTTVPEGRDVVPTDRFPIGSATKTFTAVAIVQLRDEGRLDLDDPIEKWGLPDFPRADRVTLRHLLGHTSGIFDYTRDPDFIARLSAGETIEPAEAMAIAAAAEPLFEPGAGWSYSNTNYILLGFVLEEATGRTAAAVLRDRILTPLGMKDTFLLGSEEFSGGLEVHGFLQQGFENLDVTDKWDGKAAWTAGAMVSTAPDVMRFAYGLAHGGLVSEASYAEMKTPVGLAGGDLQYGLGLVLGPQGVGHDGAVPGWMAQWMYLHDGRMVVALQNRADNGLAIGRAINGAFAAFAERN